MCGIFGVSNKLTDSPSDNLKLFSKDLKTLTQISEQRGSDTFGFVIKNVWLAKVCAKILVLSLRSEPGIRGHRQF